MHTQSKTTDLAVNIRMAIAPMSYGENHRPHPRDAQYAVTQPNSDLEWHADYADLLDQDYFTGIAMATGGSVPARVPDADWRRFIEERLREDAYLREFGEAMQQAAADDAAKRLDDEWFSEGLQAHDEVEKIRGDLKILDRPDIRPDYPQDVEDIPKNDPQEIRRYMELVDQGDVRPVSLRFEPGASAEQREQWERRLAECLADRYTNLVITAAADWPIIDIHSSVVGIFRDNAVPDNPAVFRNQRWARTVVLHLVRTRLRDYAAGAEGAANWFQLQYENGLFVGRDMFFGSVMGVESVEVGQWLRPVQGSEIYTPRRPYRIESQQPHLLPPGEEVEWRLREALADCEMRIIPADQGTAAVTMDRAAAERARQLGDMGGVWLASAAEEALKRHETAGTRFRIHAAGAAELELAAL